MLKDKIVRATMLLLASMFGAAMFVAGVNLERWRSEQIDCFNAGIEELNAHDSPDAAAALQRFECSLNAYQTALHRSWIERFVLPRPNTELAAQASFYRGMVLLQMQQAEPAVEALLLSLRLNPGGGLGSSAGDAMRLSEEAMVVKHNLELLFNQRPDLAYRQGAGREQQDGRQPQRLPGQEPGSMPGPGNRDDL